MFERAIWDKLPECIFENFKIARVKRGQFQNFQKSWGLFTPKIARTKLVITGSSHQTNKHFVLKLISFNSWQLQISERAITKQQAITKNCFNGVMSITINCLITTVTTRLIEIDIAQMTMLFRIMLPSVL